MLLPVSDRARAFVEERYAVGRNLELYAERFAALTA